MSRQKAIDALKQAKEGKSNAFWFAQRGLGMLTRGIDLALVERVMRMLAARGTLLTSLRKLPDDYVALAQRVLSEQKTVESAFVSAWRGSIQTAGRWTYELQMVEDAKSVPRLTKLATPDAIEAAQSAVATHGLRAARLLSVLAHEGSESSADIVLPLVSRAMKDRDVALDALRKWMVPFVRGAHFGELKKLLEEATTAREETTPLKDWVAARGGKGASVHFEVVFHSRDEKWSLWLVLDSKRLPHVAIALSNRTEYFSVQDFTVRRDSPKLKLKAPKSLDEFPKWLARASKRLAIKWNDAPQWATSSLRGKARATAIAWVHAAK